MEDGRMKETEAEQRDSLLKVRKISIFILYYELGDTIPSWHGDCRGYVASNVAEWLIRRKVRLSGCGLISVHYLEIY